MSSKALEVYCVMPFVIVMGNAGRGRGMDWSRLSRRSGVTTISQSSVCLDLIPTKRLRLSLQSLRLERGQGDELRKEQGRGAAVRKRGVAVGR